MQYVLQNAPAGQADQVCPNHFLLFCRRLVRHLWALLAARSSRAWNHLPCGCQTSDVRALLIASLRKETCTSLAAQSFPCVRLDNVRDTKQAKYLANPARLHEIMKLRKSTTCESLRRASWSCGLQCGSTFFWWWLLDYFLTRAWSRVFAHHPSAAFLLVLEVLCRHVWHGVSGSTKMIRSPSSNEELYEALLDDGSRANAV